MTAIDRRTQQAVLDQQTGELVPLDTSLPISADAAGELLPRLRDVLNDLRRYIQFCESVLTQQMQADGQTERRVGDVVWQLKTDGEWTVADPVRLRDVLYNAGEVRAITHDELEKAMRVEERITFDHGVLNVLSKRVPEISKWRARADMAPRLKEKR